MSVMHFRVKEVEGKPENKVEDLVEGHPRNGQAQKAKIEFTEPVEIPQCAALRHEDGNPCAAVERRDGGQVEGPQKQVQNQKETSEKGGKTRAAGQNRTRNDR